MKPNGPNSQQYDSDCNADVGHIEVLGTETADAKVHEVDHAAIVHDAIQEITKPSLSTRLQATTVASGIG